MTTTSVDTSFANRYSIVFSPSILPISAINIAATQLNGNQVLINWSVVGEEKPTNFIVERSANGIDFSNLVAIANNQLNKYQFVDENTLEGANYYRIKENNIEGITIYSKVIMLTTNHLPLTTISIIPNPVQDKLNITLTNNRATAYKIRIMTLAGKEVFNKAESTTTNSVITIPASHLATGVYLLELTDTEGNKQLKKFVKE